MTNAIELTLLDAEATRAFGSAVAEILRPDDVVSLTGELGAGKTTFVQGAAVALGVTVPVVSPTFTLIREYPAAEGLTIYHVDVYRLEKLQDVIDLGFEEMTDAGGVTFVEWGDAIQTLLTENHLDIEFRTTATGGTDERSVRIDATGTMWGARRQALEAATLPWRVAA